MGGWREELLVWIMRTGNAWTRFHVIDQVADLVLYSDAHNRTSSRDDPMWPLIERVWRVAEERNDRVALARLTWLRLFRQELCPCADLSWQDNAIPMLSEQELLQIRDAWIPAPLRPVVLRGPEHQEVFIRRIGGGRLHWRNDDNVCCLLTCCLVDALSDMRRLLPGALAHGRLPSPEHPA